ncbi:hypothetical protein [Xanthomarina sp.]|uniref:hypothetical protein n=1 Tax=Xanthomarina sp. TaxID=1931211 RepID=UPI002CF4805B|nr:hypothetical protein [Xanthomarina sp.]HLV40096.1 hypothetical protein [Xanthomarina sp.]
MILTDKQSLLICAVVTFGFSILGIIDVLDNHVIVAVLLLLFALVVANLLSSKHLFEKDEETDIEENSKNGTI